MNKSELTQIDDVAKADLKQLLMQYHTSSNGLTSQAAADRLAQDGPNTIRNVKKRSEILVFIENFTSMMAILLWISGIIAMAVHMVELGIAIWAVNVINGCFSYWQQHAAQKATDSLKKMLPSYVKVRRDGQSLRVNTEDVVTGDLIELQAGDAVPADARIITHVR